MVTHMIYHVIYVMIIASVHVHLHFIDIIVYAGSGPSQ